MPPFHKKAVAGYHDLIVGLAEDVIIRWKAGQDDVYKKMRALTLRIASALLFGHEPGDANRVGALLEIWARRNFSAPVWLFPVSVAGTSYSRLLRHAELVEGEILRLIEKRRGGSAERTDVLSLLIQARDDENRGMSNTELIGQATILFGASFETTASTLTWTLFLLAQHPRIMHQLMNELDEVLGGNAPSREELPKLSFLDCVIKESMRILPPVPFTIRAVDYDKVTMGSLLLRHGTRVICTHYLTHHLEELYPEPESFQPERWRTTSPNQYEYLPFSAGPRGCVGAMFATQVLKISLAIMLQKIRFTVMPGTRVDRVVRITMNPRYGMPMFMEKNDRKFRASPVQGQIHEMVRL